MIVSVFLDADSIHEGKHELDKCLKRCFILKIIDFSTFL